MCAGLSPEKGKAKGRAQLDAGELVVVRMTMSHVLEGHRWVCGRAKDPSHPFLHRGMEGHPETAPASQV